MKISDIFGSPDTQSPAQAASQAAAVAPNLAAPVVPGQPGNIVAPTVVADPNNPTAPVADPNATPDPLDETPLADFKDLWETVPKKEGEEEPNTTPAQLNQEELQKVVAKTDFSSILTPESLAAVTAGGDGADKALAAVLNQVAQTVMVQSISVNNKLTEKAVTDALALQSAKLPELLRNSAASDHLVTTNPLFSNPAVAPVIEATQAQLLVKFPNASHAEITKMTQDYIIALGETFAPKPDEAVTPAGDQDWSKFVPE